MIDKDLIGFLLIVVPMGLLLWLFVAVGIAVLLDVIRKAQEK